MERESNGWGGKRKGAGRKGLYAEETIKIFFYVPKSAAPLIKSKVKAELSKLTIKSQQESKDALKKMFGLLQNEE